MSDTVCVSIMKPKYTVKSSVITSSSGITNIANNVVLESDQNFDSTTTNRKFTIKRFNDSFIVYITTYDDKRSSDKLDSRDEIWKDLFDSPTPTFEDDAITKYAGSLITGDGMSDDQILESLDNY